MSNTDAYINQQIIAGMSEGLITISMDGMIEHVNPAAELILEKSANELIGKKFAGCFFEFEENDGFNQAVLDAIYDPNKSHRNTVEYFTGDKTKVLNVTTSYLKTDGATRGVIAVLSDISELYELRDAVKAMEQIRALNDRLELRNKLLSETFGRFLSDEIVKKLLDTPDGLALGGKKEGITVMMSDLRGFTMLSEILPPQDLITMLNHYLGEMTEILQRHNGTIIEFIGDGIMTIFGAPIVHGNHAEEATAAAVEMQAKMAEINKWNEEHGYPCLQMGIGVNTGDMIVGNIGSEKRTKYGVTGSHVNLCGRIESYTVGGQVLIAPTTYAMIDSKITTDDQMEVKPKGVAEPITLYSVTGVGEYNYEKVVEPVKELENPIEVEFRCIDGKHVDDETFTGKIIAKSESQAVLVTDRKLARFENIRFDKPEKKFAKVVKAEDNYLIRFTS